MDKPIIVLGKERSGTKWLTNLIANNTEVASIQNGDHGILETNMFDKMEAVFGDLKYEVNKIAFEHVFIHTRLFRITQLDAAWFRSLEYRSYLEAFKLIMDAYTKKIGAKTWVQKTNSLLANKLFEGYPNAQFIIIQRQLIDNVASSLNMGDYTFNLKSLLSVVFGYVYNQKFENKLKTEQNVLFVKYENLKSNTETTLKDIYEFLGLEFSPSFCKLPFKKNTSFVNRKRLQFSKREKFIIYCMYYIAVVTPFPILHMFRKQLHKNRAKRNIFLPGTFKKL